MDKVFKDNMNDMMKRRGINGAELSRRTGIPRTTLSSNQTTDAKFSMSNAIKIARLFGVSIEFMVTPNYEGKIETKPNFTDITQDLYINTIEKKYKYYKQNQIDNEDIKNIELMLDNYFEMKKNIKENEK